jgi:hypothetical protein
MFLSRIMPARSRASGLAQNFVYFDCHDKDESDQKGDPKPSPGSTFEATAFCRDGYFFLINNASRIKIRSRPGTGTAALVTVEMVDVVTVRSSCPPDHPIYNQ